MVRCIDCGYLEPGRHIGSINGVCTENMKKPKQIQNFRSNINCRKFVAKRNGWSTKDFHEWKDRYITMRRTFWIAIASLVISIFVGIFAAIYPIYSNQQLYQASQRADLSILDSVQWSMTNYTFTFNVSGQIRNEGARATVVESIEIGLKYTLKSGDVMYFSMETNSSELGWENSIIIEKQWNHFSLSFVVPYAWYAEIEIDQKPDEGWIRIKHDDGIDILEETKTFPLKS